MFWKTLIFFFVVCLFSSIKISAQTANFTTQELTGTYSISSGWGSQDITLNEDGTYSVFNTSDDCHINSEGLKDCANYKESGNFLIEENTLKFNILKSQRYDTDGSFKDTQLPNYELLIIKWSERFYLIGKDSLKDFANAINMKLEPRKSTRAIRYNYFYLRRESIEKKVNGLPDLPEGWNDFLLKNPIKAIILKVKNQNGERIAVINKGSDDGLKVGMQIVTGWFPDGSEIISVTKSSSTVKLKSKLKKGAKVRSYYDPDNWFLDVGFID